MPKQFNNEFWKRMCFKRNKVWVQTDENEDYVIENHKVRIKYNLKQDYEYRVSPDTLKPEDQAVPAKPKTKKGAPSKKKKTSRKDARPHEPEVPVNCIKVYTDGASSGNPGPSGIGALLIYGDNKKEISKYIGQATNTIAELTAIKVALESLKRKDLPVRIFSDSTYSIGLLTLGWKPRKNKDLVEKIKQLIKGFSDLEFIKVKGHAGIKENEVADYLATSAIKKGPM